MASLRKEEDFGEERQWIQEAGSWVVANEALNASRKYEFTDLDRGMGWE